MRYIRPFYFLIPIFFLAPALGMSQNLSCFNYVVAQDGSGNFTTVQAAFDAVPANSTTRTVIYVKNGTYQQAPLTLASNKINVTLIGQSNTGTVISYNNYNGKIDPGSGITFGTGNSASFFMNAAGFYATNIAFQNSAGPVGQALAINITGDKAVFNNCHFLGRQDTVYADRCRQYFQNCYIEGTTDFVFGPSTAVFQNCELHTYGGTALTAASTENYVTYGYVFQNCTITAQTTSIKTDLGRPWRQYAAVSFQNCNLGSVINPGGYDDWNNTANDATVRYSEYNNTSTNTVSRVPYDTILTAAQAAVYTTLNVLKTTYANPPAVDNWDPSVVIKNTVLTCGPTPTFTRTSTPTATRTFTATPVPLTSTPTWTSTPPPVSGTYARGADTSWLSQLVANGYTFQDNNGVTMNCLSVLQEKCINSIRLRVWVNPAGGWCNQADTVAKAVQAKAMGMRLLIDFHYSDTWADPGHQTKPAVWANYTMAQLTQAVSQHTNSVLTALAAAGVTPEWVQVGNETNDGMLWPVNAGDPGGRVSVNGFASFAQLINSGYSAVKAVFPSAKVIVHISNGYDNTLFRWMFDGLKAAGASWDVIGMSLYPSTTNWSTLDAQCLTNMNDMITRYGKPVMNCEVGMDVTDPTNSYAFLTDIISKNSTLPGGNGLGVFYWEPEAYNNWNGYTLVAFDNTGKPTHAMDAFGSGCAVQTPTPTRSFTPAPPTNTPTRTPTSTNTLTLTATRTNTSAATSTNTVTATWTLTNTSTPTFTFTPTFTLTKTNTLIPPTNTPTSTWTFTSTNTETNTVTSTNTSTATNSRTFTVTNTWTPTMTSTRIFTSTNTVSNTPTNSTTPTASPTATASPSSTATPTHSYTATFTNTWTVTPTNSATVTSTATSTFTSTKTFTPTSTATATNTSSNTPTSTDSPTSTFTHTHSSTPTNSFMGTASPTATATNTNTPTQTFTVANSFTPTHTSSFTPTATNSFSSTPTATSTDTSTKTSTSTPSFTSTSTASATSTSTHSNTPTATSTFTATATRTPTLSTTPTLSPSLTATPGIGTPVLYPNPVTTGDTVKIHLSTTSNLDVTIKIYTLNFRKIKQETLEGPVMDTVVTLTDKNGAPLANGIYYVVLVSGKQQWVLKLLIMR